MKTIFDPSFRYTASFNTDLKRTFARVRREHRKDTQAKPVVPASGNVASLVRKTANLGG